MHDVILDEGWLIVSRCMGSLKTPTLVDGDLRALARALQLSRATVANIRQNLVFAFGYNSLAIPIAAGILYPVSGILLSPMIAAAAMSFSSVSVIANALRLNRAI